MSDKLEPCSHCGSNDIGQGCDILPMLSECFCFCARCGIRGPGAPSQEQARAAWNAWQKESDDE